MIGTNESGRIEGLVTHTFSNSYTVQTAVGVLQGRLKGNFRQDNIRTTNPVAIGDHVLIESRSEHEYHWIVDILPRKNYIIRRATNLSKQGQVIAANLDRALLVVTVNYPITSTTFIDRFLATCEAYNVKASIIFNKTDRYRAEEVDELRQLTKIYTDVGYRCFQVSAKKGDGMEQLKDFLRQGISLFSGHSGVGKSTIINSLIPGAALRTRAISEVHNAGVHTTTHSEMIPVPYSPGAYIIDTPGIRGFGTLDFEKENICHYFPEIFESSQECKFHNCTHTHEPGCAVHKALDSGKIAQSRFQSYLSILREDQSEKYRLPYQD